jgi:hypothetical protein
VVYESVNELVNLEFGAFPSLKRRGGCGINEKLQSHRSAADGVVSSASCSGLNNFRRTDYPGRAVSERIHSIDGASTPPFEGGEYSPIAIHSHLYRPLQ